MNVDRPPAATKPEQFARLPSLDGVRGLCILLVVLHNLYPYDSGLRGGAELLLRSVAGAGWIGVQWFFVLSGFLITGILLKMKQAHGRLFHFYVRRALRIFPVYYLTLALLLFVLPALGHVAPFEEGLASQQAWYWLYLNNWMPAFGVNDAGPPHLWSLAVEEQFYCVWPWLVLWLPRRWMVAVCLFCVASSPVFRYAIVMLDFAEAEQIAYKLTIMRWDALAMGALFAIATESLRCQQWRARHGALLGFVLIALLLIVIALTRGFAPVGAGFLALNQSLAALLGVMLLNESLHHDGLFRGMLGAFFLAPFLRMLGRYSYAIYVFHVILAAMLRPYVAIARSSQDLLGPVAVEYAAQLLAAGASLGLAALSWRLLEQPLLALKERFPLAPARNPVQTAHPSPAFASTRSSAADRARRRS